MSFENEDNTGNISPMKMIYDICTQVQSSTAELSTQVSALKTDMKNYSENAKMMTSELKEVNEKVTELKVETEHQKTEISELNKKVNSAFKSIVKQHKDCPMFKQWVEKKGSSVSIEKKDLPIQGTEKLTLLELLKTKKMMTSFFVGVVIIIGVVGQMLGFQLPAF